MMESNLYPSYHTRSNIIDSPFSCQGNRFKEREANVLPEESVIAQSHVHSRRTYGANVAASCVCKADEEKG